VRLVATLRRPGIARLGAAGLLSEAGDWMLFIALPLFALSITGSSFVTATVFALELVPMVLAAPVAGVLVDRCAPWRLMRTVAVLQAVAILPLLWVGTGADLWIVYAVVVVEGLLGTVVEPCRSAAAAALVPSGELASVNQALAMLQSVARLTGAPLGGLALGLSGIDGVVLADAATFAGVAALFAPRPPRLDAAGPPAADGFRARAGREWAEGIAVVARSPALRRTAAVVALVALAQGAFVVLFVLFVVRDLGASEADVGVLRGVQATGSIAGGVLLAPLVRRIDPGRLLTASLAAIAALSLAIWNGPRVTTAFAAYVGLFVAAGVPALTTMTALLTLVQMHAPAPVRGRVLSAMFAVLGGVQAGGMLLAGLAGTGAGLTAALEAQGALYLAASLVARGLAPRPPHLSASSSARSGRRPRAWTPIAATSEATMRARSPTASGGGPATATAAGSCSTPGTSTRGPRPRASTGTWPACGPSGP
jgi:predicted MFS family arabinose efflux permease